MKQKPSFQFYQQDFLGSLDVQAMTAEEVGVYCLLIFNCYNNGGKIPNDEAVIKAICHGVAPSERVLRKFDDDGKFLTNKRITFQIKILRKFSREMSLAGKRGAESRWSKVKKTSKDKQETPHNLRHGQAIATPMAEDSSLSLSLSSIKKEIIKEKDLDPIYKTFFEFCGKRKVKCEIKQDKYLEMRTEYEHRLSWWVEVQACVNWCYDKEKKVINSLRLRNWMVNSLKFSKAKEIKDKQHFQDTKNQLKPTVKSNLPPLWTPPSS